jgi:hypothetical protein
MAPTFAQTVLEFYKSLSLPGQLPARVSVLNPYRQSDVMRLCESFYRKYYEDRKQRVLLLGINPGRLGSGATGISFTDPIRLENPCGIANTLPKKPELSSTFVYQVIDAFGGTQPFYQRFFISAVSPLGFVKEGKNINYYDDPRLMSAVAPFVLSSMDKLLAMNISRSVCFCIGEGKNFNYLQTLNARHGWFGEIHPLAHPRFIMQYKRQQLHTYIDAWVRTLQRAMTA